MVADIKGSGDGSAESLSICRGAEMAAALAQAPQVLFKAVPHFHGIMSARLPRPRGMRACLRSRGQVCGQCLALGILGISGWQFPVISGVFLADALPLHDSSPRFLSALSTVARLVSLESIKSRSI